MGSAKPPPAPISTILPGLCAQPPATETSKQAIKTRMLFMVGVLGGKLSPPGAPTGAGNDFLAPRVSVILIDYRRPAAHTFARRLPSQIRAGLSRSSRGKLLRLPHWQGI